MPKLLKKLEISIRRLSMKLMSSGESPLLVEKPESLFNNKIVKKILLIRTDRIGDFIISTGIIRNLKAVLPNAQIDIVLGKNNYSIKDAALRFCDNVYCYDKSIKSLFSELRKIRKRNYDLVIDLYDNASATASIFTSFSKSKFKLGIDKKNSEIYTHIVPLKDKSKFHIIERVANLLLPFGLNPADLDLSPEYPLPHRVNKSNAVLIAGINLAGSKEASKYWGKENFIDFINKAAKELPEAEFRIFSTIDYRPEAEEIASKTKAIPAPLTSSFDEYAALVAQCGIIITPDTAAVHLASAFKLPCVALYEASNEHKLGMVWTPYKIPYRAIRTFTGSLFDIKPDLVLQNFLDLVKEIEVTK